MDKNPTTKQRQNRWSQSEPYTLALFGSLILVYYLLLILFSVEIVDKGACIQSGINLHRFSPRAETEAALKNKYPHDKALGYTLGQIRGAFILAKDIES